MGQALKWPLNHEASVPAGGSLAGTARQLARILKLSAWCDHTIEND